MTLPQIEPRHYRITVPKNNSPEVVAACKRHYDATESLKAFNIDAQIVMVKEYLRLGATLKFAAQLTLWHFYGQWQPKYAVTAIYDKVFAGFTMTDIEMSQALSEWPGEIFLAAIEAAEATFVHQVAA